MDPYRSDLAIEISGHIAIPQDVLDALEENGTLYIDPETRDLAFFGNYLKWAPMYESLKIVMAFLGTLYPAEYQYVRLGQDSGDVVFEGEFHSETSSMNIFESLVSVVEIRHFA